MRYVTLSALVVIAIGSLAGCGEAPDVQSENSVTETTSPLVTGITLHNYQTGYCMGTAGGSSAIGSSFVVWDCDGSANQSFNTRQVLPFMPAPYFELVNNVAADRCIYANFLETCISYDAQVDVKLDAFKSTRVIINHNGRDCYTFENEQYSGQVLGVSGGSTAKGAQVILWQNYNDPVHHPDQLWCI